MASEIIIALVGLFCTTVSSIVTFFLTRRKYNSEVDSQVVQNVKNAFEAYKKVMEETISSQEQKIKEPHLTPRKPCHSYFVARFFCADYFNIHNTRRHAPRPP